MSDSHDESPQNCEENIEEPKSSSCVLNLFEEAWNEILLENPEASAGHVEIVTKDGEKKELTALQFWKQIIEDVETQKKDPNYLFTPEVEEIIAEKFTTAIEPRVEDREAPIRLGNKYYVRRSTQPYLKNLNVGVDQWFLVQDFPPKPDIIKILRRKIKDQKDDDDKLLLEKLIEALESSPGTPYEQQNPMNLGISSVLPQQVLESSPDSVSDETPSTTQQTQRGSASGEPHSREVPLAVPSTSGFQRSRSRSRNSRFPYGYRGRVRYYSAPRPPFGWQQYPVGPPPAHLPVARFAYIPANYPLPAHRALPYAGSALIPADVYWRYEAASRLVGYPIHFPYLYPSFHPRMPNQWVVRAPYPTQNPWVPQPVRQDHGVPYYPGENDQPAHLQTPNLPRYSNQHPEVNNTAAHQSTIVYSETYFLSKQRTNQVSSETFTTSNNSSYGYLDLNSVSEAAQIREQNLSVGDKSNLNLTDIGDQTLMFDRSSIEDQTNMINDSRNEWVRSNMFRCPSDLPPWSVNLGSENRLLVVTLSPHIPPVQTVWSVQSPISSVLPLPSSQSSAAVQITELSDNTKQTSASQTKEICENTEFVTEISDIQTNQICEQIEFATEISHNQIKQICEKTDVVTTEALSVKITKTNNNLSSKKTIETNNLVKKTVTTNTTTESQENKTSTTKSTKNTKKGDIKQTTSQPSSSKGKSNKKGKNKVPAKNTQSELTVAPTEQKKSGAIKKITVEFLSSALAATSKSSKKTKGCKKVDFNSEPKPSTSKGISVEFISSGQSSNATPKKGKQGTTSKPQINVKQKQKMEQKKSIAEEKFTNEESHKEEVEKTTTDNLGATNQTVDEREYLVTPTIFEILESRKNADPNEPVRPPTNYMEDVIQRKERRWKLMDKLPGCPRLNIVLDMIKKDNEMLAEEDRLSKINEQDKPIPCSSEEPDKKPIVTDDLIESTEDPFEVLRLLDEESRKKIEEEEKLNGEKKAEDQEDSSTSQAQEKLPPNTRICDDVKVELDEEEIGLLDNLVSSSSTFSPGVWVSDNKILDLKDQLFDEWWNVKAESPKKEDPLEEKSDTEPSTSQTADEGTKKSRKKKKGKKTSASSEQTPIKYSGRDETTQTGDIVITEDKTDVEKKDTSSQIEIKPATLSYADILKKKQQ